MDKYNLLYRCRLKDSDGLLDRLFMRTLLSFIFLILGVTQAGLFLYLISKDGEVGKCGISFAFMAITFVFYIYLYIFVWGRGVSFFLWDKSSELNRDEKAQENSSYQHPMLRYFHARKYDDIHSSL